jgi:hypothetical protein
MQKVAPPMIETQIRNAALRPKRSPTRPKISAPSGRKANPTPKSASAAICPAVGPSAANKFFDMIVKRLPKMKKSYHSNDVLAADAAITVVIDVCLAGGCAASSAAMSVTTSPDLRRWRRPLTLPLPTGVGRGILKRGLRLLRLSQTSQQPSPHASGER